MSFESQCENVISKMGYITSPYAFSLTHKLTYTDTAHTNSVCDVLYCMAALSNHNEYHSTLQILMHFHTPFRYATVLVGIPFVWNGYN